MHEIVTLQFGNRANYLGTHFWNTQESYFTYDPSEKPSIVDHDINFRPGIGSDGSDTYTPRALIYDLKSEFGSLRKINPLYESTDQGAVRGLWDGTQRLQTLPPVASSPYQIALETGLPTPRLTSDQVRYWSDFNRLFYHPRSLIPLSSQSLTSQLFASDSFSAGTDLFHELDQEVGGLLDRDVRLFVEECDSLQGFQIFSGNDDAWGGFMTRYMEEMREEFGKKAMWVWGLESGQRVERSKQYTRLANTSRVLSSLSTVASGYIRVSTIPSTLPSQIQLEPNSEWSTSALLSSVVESMTLPTRLRSDISGGPRIQPANMAMYEDLLANNGRNVWDLQARVRLNQHDKANDDTYANENGARHLEAAHDSRVDPGHWRDTNQGENDVDPDTRLSTYEINFKPLIPTPQSALPSLRSSARMREQHVFTQVESHRCSSTSTATMQQRDESAMLHNERLQQLYSDETVVQSYSTPLLYPVLDSFPESLFTMSNGIAASMRNEKKHIAIDAALSTTSQTKNDILAIRDIVVGGSGRSMGLIEVDKREEMYDDFTRVAELYNYGFEDELSDDEGENEE